MSEVILREDKSTEEEIITLFHEQQKLQFCGVHCLNNLLQERKFDKKRLDEIAHLLSLESAPNAWLNPHKSWLGTGNYDANVLMNGLLQEGKEVKWFDKRMNVEKINLDKIFGIIVNTCTKRFFNLYKTRHWFALRRFGDKFFNLDSQLESPTTFGNDQDFVKFLKEICQDKYAELLLVVDPQNLDSVLTN